jgi:hypothetical protein
MEWITLITGLLLPLLQNCRNKQGATEDPQEHLRNNFDESTGKFNPEIVNAAVPQTRRAIKKAFRQTPKDERKHFPRYRRDEVYDIAEKGLLKAMNATAEEAAQVMAAAAELTEDDE